MISRRAYFFWGQERMSWLRYMTLYSFKKLNPSWEVELYQCSSSFIKEKTWPTSENQDFYNYTGVDYLPEVKKLGVSIKKWSLTHPKGKSWEGMMGPQHKSNFFKWQKLSEVSGFYSDMDILFVRSMDEYYEEVKQKNTVLCFNGKFFSIGFLGSSGNNKFFRDVFLHTFESFNLHKYQSAGVRSLISMLRKLWISSKGPNKMPDRAGLWMWNLIEKSYSDLVVHNNKMRVVYPWLYNVLEHVFKIKHTSLPQECIGIHWYAGAKISQEYNNLLNEKNYETYDCTLCHFLKKILQ